MTRMRGKRELPSPQATTRAGGKRVAIPTAHPLGAAEVLLIFLCGALLLLIFAAALLPRLMGCTPYAIASDSMSPILRRGDLAFAQNVDFASLANEDIVVFQTETGLVTHRVYSIDYAGGTLRTKADASAYLDTRPVGAEELVGRVVYKLPLLGYISLLLGGEGAQT